MWLAYLRFDTGQDTRVALVQCGNAAETNEVLRVAKEVFGATLTEYATFYSGRTIRPMQVPNFPEDLIFSYTTFLQACGVAPGQTWQPGSPHPQHPPGRPGQVAPPALLAEGRKLLGNG